MQAGLATELQVLKRFCTYQNTLRCSQNTRTKKVPLVYGAGRSVGHISLAMQLNLAHKISEYII